MNKHLKIFLSAVCICLAAAAALHIQLITLENGERTLVCLPLRHRPGGSVFADLEDQLAALYGEEGLPVEENRVWQGDFAVVSDTPHYAFQYLGRSFDGGDYILCTVTTARTVLPGGGAALPGTIRRSVYIGYDDADLNSPVRAKILWKTLREEYSDGEAYFNDGSSV